MVEQRAYIGAMSTQLKGPVATEIKQRLRAALSPEQLAVIDDSEKHRGHAGHDGSGESHFTVEIVSAEFADLLRDKVHALAIKARAPGEA